MPDSMVKRTVGLVLKCATVKEWQDWLERNHGSEAEAWLRLVKKSRQEECVARSEALEVALCYGWIDGQGASLDEDSWLQRFTPRTKRSKWSEINRDAAEALIRAGKMKPAGLGAVAAAKADGRWQAAYAPSSTIQVPDDFMEALHQSPGAETFFQGLNARNRYAILYRIQDAKKSETRARRITKFVDMLERGETLH